MTLTHNLETNEKVTGPWIKVKVIIIEKLLIKVKVILNPKLN